MKYLCFLRPPSTPTVPVTLVQFIKTVLHSLQHKQASITFVSKTLYYIKVISWRQGWKHDKGPPNQQLYSVEVRNHGLIYEYALYII